MSEAELDFSNVDWNDSIPYARSKTFEKGGKIIRLVEFSRGFEESEWCVKGHIGYVCEGQLEIDFNDGLVKFREGDGIFILAGKQHKARPVGEKVLLFLVEDA